jgi:hypothetical protein
MIARSAALIKLANEQSPTVLDFPKGICIEKFNVFARFIRSMFLLEFDWLIFNQ